MGTKEDTLRRVRLLLDKADSTKFEAEADSLRQKADELMLRYAIESAEVDAARGQKREREQPTVGRFFFCYADNPIKDQLVRLLSTVGQHTRCKIVMHGVTGTHHLECTASVVGFPADTEYAEMMYTNLWAQLSRDMEPKPNPDQTFEENVVMLMESSVSRKRIAELMGLDWSHQLGLKMSKVYKEWTEAHGRSPKRPLAITYMRNFADGFVGRVDIRLYDIRKRSRQHVEEEKGSGMELVLVDKDKQVQNAFRDAFPSLGTYRSKTQARFDAGARQRGDDAGKRADLGQKRVGNPKRPLPGRE